MSYLGNPPSHQPRTPSSRAALIAIIAAIVAIVSGVGGYLAYSAGNPVAIQQDQTWESRLAADGFSTYNANTQSKQSIQYTNYNDFISAAHQYGVKSIGIGRDYNFGHDALFFVNNGIIHEFFIR